MKRPSKRVQTRVKRGTRSGEFPRENKKQIVTAREQRKAWLGVLVCLVRRAADHGWDVEAMITEARMAARFGLEKK